jgi:hypothetical protein
METAIGKEFGARQRTVVIENDGAGPGRAPDQIGEWSCGWGKQAKDDGFDVLGNFVIEGSNDDTSATPTGGDREGIWDCNVIDPV